MFPTFELVPPLKFPSVNWSPPCWASKKTTELAVCFPHGQAPDQLLSWVFPLMRHNCPCFCFLRGGPVLILVNFRGGPVLILELFSILVIFRVGPVKKNTLYILTQFK